MIGTSARWAPRRWATSKPSMSGSITSSTIRCGRNALTLASASSPDAAVSTPKPWKRSAMATTSTMFGSSSTTSTRGWGGSAPANILAAPAVVEAADRADRGAVLLDGLHGGGGSGAAVVAESAGLAVGEHPADLAVAHLLGQPGDADRALAAREAADAGHVGAVGDDRRRRRRLAGHDDGPAAMRVGVGHRVADPAARAERASGAPAAEATAEGRGGGAARRERPADRVPERVRRPGGRRDQQEAQGDRQRSHACARHGE